MVLSDEQAKYVKEQLMKQLENVAEDKREAIKNLVLKMNNEELEKFLIKNGLIKPNGEASEESTEEGEEQEGKKGGQCIFCMIASKQIPALPIYEDKDYDAVLEINPLSSGHVILIPKSHVASAKDLDAKAFAIAKKIGNHLLKKLKAEKAEDFQVTSSDELGHAIINIIPKYEGKETGSERKPAKKEDLQQLAEKIGKLKSSAEKSDGKAEKQESKSEKSGEKTPKLEEKKIPEAILKLPRRIP